MQVKLAAVGLGRIGVIHATNAAQVAAETPGAEFVAVVDSNTARASQYANGARVFASIEEMLGATEVNAAVLSTPTEMHAEHAGQLIRAGVRVLLEKPMTESLAKDRLFAAELDAHHPNGLMLAFQRRFDAPLRRMKQWIEEGAIGRVFKVTSMLEDSGPAPAWYRSGGLLQDMSVHNVDELLWMTGRMPTHAASGVQTVYSARVQPSEDGGDDGYLWLWFGDDLLGHIQVSRNHVSGYRIESWAFGEEGQIHMGRFEQNRREVIVEAYSRTRQIAREVFTMPEYPADVPEFVPRFGPAYKEEVRTFVECCLNETPFPVTHHDGIRAMEVIEAALATKWTRDQATRL